MTLGVTTSRQLDLQLSHGEWTAEEEPVIFSFGVEAKLQVPQG